jgi:hypothetical protein
MAKESNGSTEPVITVVSNDDQKFQLPKSAAINSGFIVHALNLNEDEDEGKDTYVPVDVTRVSGNALEKVVEFLKHYAKEPMPAIGKPLQGNSFNEVSNSSSRLGKKDAHTAFISPT